MDRFDRADLYHYFVEVGMKKFDRIMCAIICGLSLGYGLAVVMSKLGL